MMAVVAITFTACGGDDDDLNNGISGSATTWVEPYLRWDATLDQIKADMAAQGWTAQVSEGNILQYGNNSRYPGVTMNMGVLNSRTNTLSTTQVAYMNVPSDFFNKILSEVVTRYNATWRVLVGYTLARALPMIRTYRSPSPMPPVLSSYSL